MAGDVARLGGADREGVRRRVAIWHAPILHRRRRRRPRAAARSALQCARMDPDRELPSRAAPARAAASSTARGLRHHLLEWGDAVARHAPSGRRW